MRRALLVLAAVVLAAVALGACGKDVPPAARCEGVRCTGSDLCDPATGACVLPDGGVRDDGGGGDGGPTGDAGLDGGDDAGADGGPDAGLDAGLDAGVDAGCRSDLDCFGSTQACVLDAGVCVECTADLHCFGVTARCDTTRYTCVECLGDSQCISAAPRCDPVKNQCFGCLSNTDCPAATPICDATRNCLPCNTNAECGAGRACAFAGDCTPLPDACGTAQALTLPGGLGTASFSVEPALALDDYPAGCNALGGPELVYRFTTPGVRDFTASLTPLYGSSARPVLTLHGPSACPGVEVACDAQLSGAGSIAFSGLAAGTWYVFAESAGGAPGRMTLQVTLANVAQPPANDTCAAPLALSFAGNTATVVGNTQAAANDVSASCSATSAAGPDLSYSYTLTARSNVTVRVKAVTGSPLHPVLSVRGACATAGTELGCVASVAGEAHQLSFPGQAPGTYTVWVDSADGTTGAFQLDLAATPTVDNDTCAAAQALSFVGQTAAATGETTFATNGNGGADPTPSCSTSARSSGLDVVYSYTLAAAQDVTVTVTPTGASPTYQPVVYVRSACAATAVSSELACVSLLASTATSAVLVNQPAGTYFVWVDGAQGTAGPFQLEVTAAAPTPPPANDTCTTPQVLSFTGGVATVSASTAQAANDNAALDVSPTCSASAKQNGRDVIYAFDVAARSDATITVTPAAGSPLHPALYVRKTSCTSQLLGDELTCLERVGVASSTLPGLAAGRYFIWVDGAGGTSGAFTLSVALSAPTPPPANDGCPGAALSFSGSVASVTGSTVGAGNSNSPIDLAPTCGAGFFPRKFGRDVVYSYTLAAAQDVDIQVAPLAGSLLVPAVYVRAPNNCTNFSPGWEVGCMAATQVGPTRLYLPNQQPGTYFLFVDSMTYDMGAFSLAVTLRAPTLPPANDSCAGALVAVPPGPTGVTGDTTGARDDYSSSSTPATYAAACGGQFFSGRDVVYQFTAAATGSVTATVTPQAGFDPALLLLLPLCGPGACVRASDAAGPGGAEALTFSATSGQTYFLVVDSYDGTQPFTSGAFQLTVQ